MSTVSNGDQLAHLLGGHELPGHWEILPLGEVVEMTKRPKGLERPSAIPFIPMQSISDRTLDLRNWELRPEGDIRSGTYCEAGDVLLARITPCFENGKLGIVGEVPNGWGMATTEVYPLRSSRLEPRFLAYFLKAPAVRDSLLGAMEGATGRMRVPKEALEALPVPIPPRDEQDRIVQWVEARETTISSGQEALSLGLQRAASLRSVLMAQAVEGPWPRVALRDVLVSLRNGVFVSRPAVDPPGIRIFRISAVRPLSLLMTDVRYAPADLVGYENFLVREGDLLFTRYSGNADYVGACARVSNLDGPTLYPDKLIRAVVDRSQVLPEFFELVCSTGRTLTEIRGRRKTTAGQVGIAGGQLATVSVPLPPLEAQRLIVHKVSSQLTAIREVENTLRATSSASRSLFWSVLATALRGNLYLGDRRSACLVRARC